MEHGTEYPLPVITSDDVRVIERYVREGKALPVTADDVKKVLPSSPDSLITDVTANYTTIRDHARSWETVQKSMTDISTILIAFSKDVCEYGDDAVTHVKNMEGYKSRKIASLTPQELESFPSISLDGDDQRTIPDLIQTVNYIKKSIIDKKTRSVSALQSLETFKRKLIGEVEPWIGSMIQLSNPDALDTEIANLHREILKLGDSATQVTLKPTFMGTILGFAKDLAVTLSVIERDKKSATGAQLIKRREDALNQIVSRDKFKGILQTLHISMGSLYDAVTPAINTVTHLHSHWEAVIFLIDDSLSRFRSGADYALLGLFVRKLEALLADWRNVENNSTALINAFRLDIR
ncbi:hypothetical protein [Pseudomonas fluorescens]|uniref:hypothetical protein n=1 Tax=Pseudomonas TaxID=286 RepID=UPI003CFE73CC